MFKVKRKKEKQIEYLLNGEYHREDGPAVEEVGSYKSWYYQGNRHRLDGPAIEYNNEDAHS